MHYRLKKDGVYLDRNDEATWHPVTELDYYHITIEPGSKHRMTLEWSWPFESGRDENDTLVGVYGGKISVVFFVWAEVIPEEFE